MTKDTVLNTVHSDNKDDEDTVEQIVPVINNIIIIIYVLTIVLGTAGNTVVIWVAGFKLKPTVTNVWLVNLAVADLIFCVNHSITLIKKLFFDYWPFSEFLCKFVGFFNYANMFCSVFLLSVISMDRAMCIWHPVITKRRRTLFNARLASAAVWLGAIVLSAPYFVYRKEYQDKKNLSQCSMDVKGNKESEKLALYWIRFLCGFLLPFLVIFICYVLAGLGIRRTRLSRKSRSLRILALLVFAFFLCWAPYHCFLLARMMNKNSTVVHFGVTITKCFAYFNSCVNPLLYFCMGLHVKGSKFGRSLVAVYQRALADDGDGQTLVYFPFSSEVHTSRLSKSYNSIFQNVFFPKKKQFAVHKLLDRV